MTAAQRHTILKPHPQRHMSPQQMNNSAGSVLTDHARAKVNLTLHVLGRRADGYHELESVVVFADCADTIELAESDRLTLAVSGPRAAECGALDDNLILRAARNLAGKVGNCRVGAFVLDKHLPAAAGIGGGSADAAAALRLLARHNGLALDDVRLREAAAATGADVPVCLASAACIMRGVGERITPLPVPRLPAVLVNPGVPVATKDVFAALGLKPGQTGRHAPSVHDQWPDAKAGGGAWLAAIISGRNDLQAPAVQVQPVIADVLDALRTQTGCRLARMSGSGATCFGLFDNDAAASDAAKRLQAVQPRWWVQATTLR